MTIKLEPEYAEQFMDLFGPEPCPEPANPRIEQPGAPGDSASPLGAPAYSLTEQLGDLVDDLRQLYTNFGLRPYRVFSIVYEWTGGEPGKGTQRILSELELLPTPKVDLSGAGYDVTSAGKKPSGTARLTEVSPRYTEDQLDALLSTRLPDGQHAFIEVRADSRDGATVRRRFAVSGAPYREPDRFQWVVPLRAQQSPRDRDTGELSGPVLYPERLRREVRG